VRRPLACLIPCFFTPLHEWSQQDIDKAIGVLEDFLQEHPAAGSLTHFNILAELHLQQGRHQRVADVVRTAADTFGNQELPIDLQVGKHNLGAEAF